VLDAFLLRALENAGYGMALGACARCGVRGEHNAMQISAGGVVCTACRTPGSVLLSPAAIDLLLALRGGDWSVADASERRTRRDVSGVVAAHLQWHLERGLRSLPLVERETPTPAPAAAASAVAEEPV
jgi:DNA repair protein RecO (recombination protein O)